MASKKASELSVGDRFLDPVREGRRPAQVIELVELADVTELGNKRVDDRIHVTLDDDTQWGSWAAAYEPDELLEML